MNFQDRPAKDGKIESGNEDGIMAVSSTTEERTSDENAKKSNLSITLNSSDLADDNIPKEDEPIYKHKFTLNELYQYSLQFYKKGDCEFEFFFYFTIFCGVKLSYAFDEVLTLFTMF